MGAACAAASIFGGGPATAGAGTATRASADDCGTAAVATCCAPLSVSNAGAAFFLGLAVHSMSRTSSLNCLSSRNPYQTPHSSLLVYMPPLFAEDPLLFTEKCFVASPSQKSALVMAHRALTVGGFWQPSLAHDRGNLALRVTCLVSLRAKAANSGPRGGPPATEGDQ